MNSDGFIKIHRKMLAWEWYTDTNTKVVFLHCLFKANWKDGRYKGQVIKRGSFVTGRKKLAKELNMTEREIRTALEHLKTTNELTIKTTNKYSIVTVVNYNIYQDIFDDERPTKRPTKRQSSDQQTTTIEERKNIRNKEYISHGDEPHLFGVYNNVRLTDGELEELMKQYPEDYKDMIENLSSYMRSHGKLYGDHYATMMRWKHEDEIKAQETKKAAAYDYRKDVI